MRVQSNRNPFSFTDLPQTLLYTLQGIVFGCTFLNPSRSVYENGLRTNAIITIEKVSTCESGKTRKQDKRIINTINTHPSSHVKEQLQRRK